MLFLLSQSTPRAALVVKRLSNVIGLVLLKLSQVTAMPNRSAIRDIVLLGTDLVVTGLTIKGVYQWHVNTCCSRSAPTPV